MSSDSAFRRGDGTWSAVRRATAELRSCLSCTIRSNSPRRPCLLPLIAKVNHLADVVLHMRCTLQDHGETCGGIGTGSRVVCRPILQRLCADGPQHHRDGIIEM